MKFGDPIHFKTDGSNRRGRLIEHDEHNAIVQLSQAGPAINVSVPLSDIVDEADEASDAPAAESAGRVTDPATPPVAKAATRPARGAARSKKTA